MTSTRLALTGALLFAACATGQAAPTHYVLHDFTLERGTIAPASGHFTYDPEVGFSDFLVEWNDITFDLTWSANRPVLNPNDAFRGQGHHSQAFQLLTKSLPTANETVRWVASGDCGIEGECLQSVLSFGTMGEVQNHVSFHTMAGPDIYDGEASSHAGRFLASAVPEVDTLTMLAAGLLTVSGVFSTRRNKPSA